MSLFKRLVRVLFPWSQKHKTPKLLAFEFYGGPRDGATCFYSGLILRLPRHPDGAYCFRGESYRWTRRGCEQGVNNL
jgi:hypothetical protein